MMKIIIIIIIIYKISCFCYNYLGVCKKKKTYQSVEMFSAHSFAQPVDQEYGNQIFNNQQGHYQHADSLSHL